MSRTRFVAVLSFSALLLTGCGGEKVDLLIVGGSVIDGTGTPATDTAVGLLGDRIVFVGDPKDADAERVIDVMGLIVAPGFIDVHNHTPPAISDRDRRHNEGVIRQGVTTVVGGPDGSFSPKNIRQLETAYEANGGIGTNVAFYVGHNAVRYAVMGEERGVPTDEQLAEMKAQVREGMEMGAVGFSSGLMYPPGMFSATAEVAALAAEVAPFGGIYDSHVRNPVHAFVGSHAEAIEVGRRAGIPAKLGHLKSVGLKNEGKITEVIELVESARAEGRNVVSDQYPYDGAATSTLVPGESEVGSGVLVVPPDMLAEGEEIADFDFKAALSRRSTRARLKEASEQGIDGGFAWLKATGYGSMRIVDSEDYPDLVGSYLAEIAEERAEDPFDVIAELVIGAEQPVYLTLGAIREREVRELLVQPWNMPASDGAYLDASSVSGHPRSTGTFPRLLGHYVRELGLLSLEEAVRKITSFPAEYLSLDDRGRIEVGMAADVVVFDPETIIDNSTWTEPQRFASGVVHVIVNGVPVLEAGEMTGASPGTMLRRSTPSPD
jgi:N-acyl-D-aspartate/D-glutamate deacylase